MNEKINELVLDPRWRMGSVIIDGNKLLFIAIEHPRHGPICFQLPRASLTMLRDSITRLLEPPGSQRVQ